jgi:hypothetical protein
MHVASHARRQLAHPQRLIKGYELVSLAGTFYSHIVSTFCIVKTIDGRHLNCIERGIAVEGAEVGSSIMSSNLCS